MAREVTMHVAVAVTVAAAAAMAVAVAATVSAAVAVTVAVCTCGLAGQGEPGPKQMTSMVSCASKGRSPPDSSLPCDAATDSIPAAESVAVSVEGLVA